MLGRKTFTTEELDAARTAIGEQLTAFGRLAAAVDGEDARSALRSFEPPVFNGLLLALDRRFVHRLRAVTGKDGNPLNEVELLAESLLNNGGVLRGNNVIKYVPEESVLGLEIGDEIELDAERFERISGAFLAELEAKFVAASQPA